VKRRQLLALGLGEKAIEYRVKTRRLIPAHTGVYAVGHVPTLPQDRAFGALLACGPEAALSHSSALTLWGVFRRWDIPFEVAAPTLRKRPGIRTHRAKLTRADIRIHEGIRVTSPARTLLDMAPRLTDKQLRRAFNNLRLSHGLEPGQLANAIGRFPRHPGARRLEPLAETRRGATRSGIEDKFADFCERYGFPEPLFNARVAGREVDAYFPAERVIVEIDGYEVHSGRISFEDDRDRDANMLALDLPTVRVTEERLDNQPEKEGRRLHAILEMRRRHRGIASDAA
jgi:hypothetical protein